MKLKFILLLLFFNTCFVTTKAQLTADFPDSNYYWNEEQAFYDIDFPHRNQYYDGTIYYNGNISFENITYQKIHYKYVKTYYVYENNSLLTKYENNDILLGYILNDKLNKKVYFKAKSLSINNDTNLNLLFDFNLKVGDAYPITINNNDANAVVRKIDTIVDPYGIKRAVYNMYDTIIYSNFYRPVIQGLGFCGGFLNKNLQLPFEGYFADINCFSFNNKKFEYSYQNGSTVLDSSSGNVIEFMGMYNSKKSEVSISPNPVSTQFTLEISDEEIDFEISNTLGQTRKLKGIKDGHTWRLDISNLEPGIYNLNARSLNSVYSSKLVKL